MKKTICVILVLLIGSIAIAENIDIESMSNEELFALWDRVSAEVENRINGKTVIHSWYDYGMGQYVPSFDDVIGINHELSNLGYNNDEGFAAKVRDVADDEFSLYCNILDQWGFTFDKSTRSHLYEANNGSGIEVSAYVIGDDMTIKVYRITQSIPTQDMPVDDLQNAIEYSSWFDDGIGVYAPNPNEVFGRTVSFNSNDFILTDERLVVEIENADHTDFDLYVKALEGYGFTNIGWSDDHYYWAQNDTEIEVTVTLINGLLQIMIQQL